MIILADAPGIENLFIVLGVLIAVFAIAFVVSKRKKE
jgi:LPXTG-motif cell wall-anchored protein